MIEDYGSALVGRQTIDLFFPSRKDVRGWGVRTEQIEIVEWGSEAMSLKLLAPRCRNGHVAVMVAQLRKQGVVPSNARRGSRRPLDRLQACASRAGRLMRRPRSRVCIQP